MIYVAALATPAKKALGDVCFQTNLDNIIEKLSIDPELSSMDAVILSNRDINALTINKIKRAVEKQHPDICVIYLYDKDKDKDLIDCKYKKFLRKIRPEEIKEAQKEFLGEHYQIRSGKNQIIRRDALVEEVVQEVAPTAEMAVVEENKAEPEIPTITLPDETLSDPVSFESVEKSMTTSTESSLNIEESLSKINNYQDWNLFKEQMEQDVIVKKLIEENTEYLGLINMLNVMDSRIRAIWSDNSLKTEEKFREITDMGRERSTLKARSNKIYTEKAIGIIETIAIAAKRTVDEKIENVNKSMAKVLIDQQSVLHNEKLDRTIAKRANTQVELLNLGLEIIELYKSMNALMETSVKSYDKGLPSENEFINALTKGGTEIFTPVNSAALASAFVTALKDNLVSMSQLEDKVQGVVQLIHQMFAESDEVIEQQQYMMELIRANKVENVVIVDSLLKNVLRLYSGAEDTGVTATTLTWCGILSRRHNSLLIDITGKRKFKDYGVEAMELNDFLVDRAQRQFLCVQSDKLDSEAIQELVHELKKRIDYYPYINIIVSPEDTDVIDQLSKDALTMHYITNCTKRSIGIMRDMVSKHTSPNIAHKLITIDAPINPIACAEEIGLDTLNLNVVPIPNIPDIKACNMKGDRPYEYAEIIKVFEEAFRQEG